MAATVLWVSSDTIGGGQGQPYPDRNRMTVMPHAALEPEGVPLVEGSNADLTANAPIAGKVFEPLFCRGFDARSLDMLSRLIQFL